MDIITKNPEVIDKVVKGGKYGVIALGIIAIYNLVDKAMEKDYSVVLDAKNQKIEFKK